VTNITSIFETSPNTKPKEKKWVGHVLRVPHQLAPMCAAIHTYHRNTTIRGLLEGISCLHVGNVKHVLDPVFFISSHGVGRLFTYKVLVVISGQIGFTLKIALKC